jgi:hypothetical protein
MSADACLRGTAARTVKGAGRHPGFAIRQRR